MLEKVTVPDSNILCNTEHFLEEGGITQVSSQLDRLNAKNPQRDATRLQTFSSQLLFLSGHELATNTKDGLSQ